MGRGDPPKAGMPVNGNTVFLDPIDDVRQNPGLHGAVEALTKVHQGHGSTRAPALQSGIYATVPCPDHDDLLMPVGVPLDEIVGDVGKIFSRNVQEIRIVVISRCEHQGLRLIRLSIVPPLYLDPKPAVYRGPGQSLDQNDVLTRTNVEVVVLRYPPVVDQAVAAVRLLVAGDERDPAYFDPLGSGEEGHAERVALDGRYDRTPVEQYAGDTRLLRGNAHRKAAGPRSYDQQVDPVRDVLPRFPAVHLSRLHQTSMIWSRLVPTLT